MRIQDLREEASESRLGMVRLVELVLRPREYACPLLATPTGANRLRCAAPRGSRGVGGDTTSGVRCLSVALL